MNDCEVVTATGGTDTTFINWSVEYSVVVDGETVYFDPQFVQVIPAAADPSAIADALSTVQDTLENASGGHGIELSIMTSGPSRYRQG